MAKKHDDSKTIYYWLDSGANIHSCNRGSITLNELGLTDEEWEAMPGKDKDNLLRELAFEGSDWGWSETKPDNHDR